MVLEAETFDADLVIDCTGGFDVEVDLNPYVPDEPYELDEVTRLAGIILQVARST